MTGIFNSLLGAKKSTSQEYQFGYADAEKKYQNTIRENEVLVSQIRQLGYEIGEKPDPVRNAAFIKKLCKSSTDCNSCPLNSGSGCVLSGENPSQWKIMA